MHILLIEDDEKTAGFISLALKQAGYAVTRCADGEEGMVAVLNGPYDAAVIDIMLPKRDGISVIRGLRAAGRSLPVIVVMDSSGNNLYESAVSEYLRKYEGIQG